MAVRTNTVHTPRGDELPPVIAHGKMGKLILADGNLVPTSRLLRSSPRLTTPSA